MRSEKDIFAAIIDTKTNKMTKVIIKILSMTVVAILLLACNGKQTKASVGDIFDEANDDVHQDFVSCK